MHQMLIITAEQCGFKDRPKIAKLLRSAKSHGTQVVDLLLDSGELNERRFLRQLSENLMVPWWEPERDWSWHENLSWLISSDDAARLGCVPIYGYQNRSGGKLLHVATYNPLDAVGVQQISRACNAEVKIHFTARQVVREGIESIYGGVALAA